MLELRGVERGFRGRPVLSGLDLEVARGEIVAVIGPSGAGKSTLLRIVAGLERAERGSVRWEDRDLAAVAPADRGVGMTFDDAALYDHLDVRGNLHAGLARAGIVGAEADRAAARAAELTGAAALLAERPATLSAGERRRVALARAIARRPRILLLDEPLAHLDLRSRLDLREDLRRVHEATGAATILVTHEHEDALSIADRLAYLDEGRVLQAGPPGEFERPSHVAVARGRAWRPLNVVSDVRATGEAAGWLAFEPVAATLSAEGGGASADGGWRARGRVHFIERCADGTRTIDGAAGIVVTVDLGAPSAQNSDGTRANAGHGPRTAGTSRVRCIAPAASTWSTGMPVDVSVFETALLRYGADGLLRR